MKKLKKTVSFVLAALLLAVQLVAAPVSSFPSQAAPVTFPDGTVFDPEYYAAAYPEVTAAVGNNGVRLWVHYFLFGREEGRAGVAAGNAAAPPAAGKKVTPEQVAAVKALIENAGKQNDGAPPAAPAAKPAAAAPTAPAAAPAATAAKPAAAAPAAAASVVFDPVYYANRYADVKAAFGTDAAKLWQHYRLFGEKEGRQAAKNHVPGTKVNAPSNVRELPAPAAAAAAKQGAAPAQPAAPVIVSNGTRVAFIGDSITTFGGQLPPGYEPFYPWEGLDNLAQTWWYQVSARKGLQIAVNASWSGCRVTGNRNDETGKCASSYARVATVAAAQPNIVFIMLGTNDFTGNVNTAIFRDAYMSLVSQLRASLPNATIVCCTCIPENIRWKNAQGVTIDAYNQEIRTVAAQTGCALVDTYACGITNQQMIDGLHPNAEGAAVIANFVVAHMPPVRR